MVKEDSINKLKNMIDEHFKMNSSNVIKIEDTNLLKKNIVKEACKFPYLIVEKHLVVKPTLKQRLLAIHIKNRDALFIILLSSLIVMWGVSLPSLPEPFVEEKPFTFINCIPYLLGLILLIIELLLFFYCEDHRDIKYLINKEEE